MYGFQSTEEIKLFVLWWRTTHVTRGKTPTPLPPRFQCSDYPRLDPNLRCTLHWVVETRRFLRWPGDGGELYRRRTMTHLTLLVPESTVCLDLILRYRRWKIHSTFGNILLLLVYIFLLLVYIFLLQYSELTYDILYGTYHGPFIIYRVSIVKRSLLWRKMPPCWHEDGLVSCDWSTSGSGRGWVGGLGKFEVWRSFRKD